MTPDFAQRFSASPGNDAPLSLQLLYPTTLDLDPDGLAVILRDYHHDLASVSVEFIPVSQHPEAGELVSADGPPASLVGLIEWGSHRIRLAGFDAPMPYGPIRTCVEPAAMAPEIKADAIAHAAHVLLYYAGEHPEILERYVALGVVAGALARFGAIVTLNEEARSAIPAFDLIPADGEDLFDTLRKLPLPYLFAGFVKLDVGDEHRPWARTFAAHRFGLPDLARHLAGHHETSDTFHLFSGILAYLHQSGEKFLPGDSLDLGDRRLSLRSPTEEEWYLEGTGEMLVIEPLIHS